MTVWATASKADQLAIRREMLVQAEKALAGLYASKAQRQAAARVMVDKALAKERQHEIDDGSTQIDTDGQVCRA